MHDYLSSTYENHLRLDGKMEVVEDLKQAQKNFNDDADCNVDTESTVKENILGPETFHETFDTAAYLKDFYTNVDDPAMQMVIFYLPNIVVRIPQCETLLDFGAGPTIHVAVCFRNKVNEVYLADYLPQNRSELMKWKIHKSEFNWTKTLKLIGISEGLNLMTTNLAIDLEEFARQKVREILYCNCHIDPPLEVPSHLKHSTFDIITTFYTIEYCSNTLEEYHAAILRLGSLVNPNGYFIMGAILEENWCSFGGRKFKCLYITKEFVLKCFGDAGFYINETGETTKEQMAPIVFEVNGMLIICCQKL